MNSKSKIITDLSKLKSLIAMYQRQGKVIAFTNGCFDILHLGHINYLETAKKVNRILIVGLNSNTSVRKIKGKHRPIVPQRERARILAALSCVDFVVIFNEETPYNLIKALRPDVLIKGADWKDKHVVGREIVESYGGKVELIQYIPGSSTTRLIETIIKKCKK